MQLPQATLTLDKHGSWQLAPADKTVSADAIQKLMDAWQQNLAIGVTPIGKAAGGRGAPAGRPSQASAFRDPRGPGLPGAGAPGPGVRVRAGLEPDHAAAASRHDATPLIDDTHARTA